MKGFAVIAVEVEHVIERAFLQVYKDSVRVPLQEPRRANI